MTSTIENSLAALLQAAVDDRVAELQAAADAAVESIRKAAAEVVQRFEQIAQGVAAGDQKTTLVPPQAPSQATPTASAVAPAVGQSDDPDGPNYILPVPGSGLIQARWIAGRTR
jgi:hypothetical protein